MNALQAIIATLFAGGLATVVAYVSWLKRKNNILENRGAVDEIKKDSDLFVNSKSLPELIEYSNSKSKRRAPE